MSVAYGTSHLILFIAMARWCSSTRSAFALRRSWINPYAIPAIPIDIERSDIISIVIPSTSLTNDFRAQHCLLYYYINHENSNVRIEPMKEYKLENPWAQFLIASVDDGRIQSQPFIGRKVEAEAAFGNEPKLRGERPLVSPAMTRYASPIICRIFVSHNF